MRSLKIPMIAALVAVAFFLVAHKAVSQGLVLNPNVLTYSCSSGCNNVATQIASTNPSRRSIWICNPTASVIVWIAPGSVTAAANGAGSYSLPAVSSGTTTCWKTQDGVAGPGGAGNSWNAIGASTPFTLSVFEWD